MYHIASCDFAGSQKKFPSYVFAVPLSDTKCVVNRINALLSDHTYRVSIRFIPSPILLASAVQTPPTSHARFEIGFAFASTAEPPPGAVSRATPRALFIITMPTKPKQNTASTIVRFIGSPRLEFFPRTRTRNLTSIPPTPNPWPHRCPRSAPSSSGSTPADAPPTHRTAPHPDAPAPASLRPPSPSAQTSKASRSSSPPETSLAHPPGTSRSPQSTRRSCPPAAYAPETALPVSP